jgi:hypothetical protein
MSLNPSIRRYASIYYALSLAFPQPHIRVGETLFDNRFNGASLNWERRGIGADGRLGECRLSRLLGEFAEFSDLEA